VINNRRIMMIQGLPLALPTGGKLSFSSLVWEKRLGDEGV
jgi:hypothetical protein